MYLSQNSWQTGQNITISGKCASEIPDNYCIDSKSPGPFFPAVHNSPVWYKYQTCACWKISWQQSILLIAETPLCVCLCVCVSQYSSETTGSFELKFCVKMHLTSVNVLIYVSWPWPQGQGHSKVKGQIYVYSYISVSFEARAKMYNWGLP